MRSGSDSPAILTPDGPIAEDENIQRSEGEPDAEGVATKSEPTKTPAVHCLSGDLRISETLSILPIQYTEERGSF